MNENRTLFRTTTQPSRAYWPYGALAAALLAAASPASGTQAARPGGAWTRQVRTDGETWIYHFTVPASPAAVAGVAASQASHSSGGEAIRDRTASPARRPEGPPAQAVGTAAAAVDLEAQRAYLNTAPAGEGDNVETPAVGETVYFHFDYRVLGASGEVTYTRRAIFDGDSFCSGSSTVPSGDYFAWCNDGWVATAGSHTLRWDIDFDNVVAESNESNNSASTNWTSAAPGQVDIVAERAYLNTETAGAGTEIATPSAGQTVYFHVDYRIIGTGGAVVLDRRALIDGETFCDFSSAPTPGAYFAWCLDGWVATAGEHTLRWDLDYDNKVSESDESNNTATAMWTSASAGSIDIIAERAFLNTMTAEEGDEVTTPAVGQQVYFHLDFRVDGSTAAVAVDRRAVIDGETFCDFTGNPTSGSYFTWCAGPWIATAGSHTLRWDLDYSDRVAETNESNNSASTMWTSGGASCAGDCNGDGEVTVNELITMVNIALGSSPVPACTAGDANGDGEITVNEIVAGANRALTGCG